MKPPKELSLLILLLYILFSVTQAKTSGIDKIKPYVNQTDKPLEDVNNIKTITNRLHFEPNVGQTDASVRFLSRTYGYSLFLTPGEAIVSVRNTNTDETSQESYSSVRMQFIGSNPDALITGLDIIPGITNYYIGNNPENWHTNIVNYGSINYKEVYPGIDLIFYGNEGRLEYDFIISPHGNPKDIHLNFITNEKMYIDEHNNLVIIRQNNSLILNKPFAYQDTKEGRRMVDATFKLTGNNHVKFVVGKYNHEYPLIIDPVLVFTSYLGGSKNDWGYGIDVDPEGNIYVTGSTQSDDFPTYNSYQNNIFPGQFSYSTDVFVTKFNSDGTDIIYSTYLGGRGNEGGEAIAVDANGQVCITGRTSSGDNSGTPEYEGFPLMNAYQSETSDNSDAFVSVLNSSGQLAYSTYLGGKYEDYGTDIAVDDYGDVYVTGTVFSFDFPIKNAFMENIPSYYYAIFVTKIDPTKSGDESLVYSTFLGGEYDDYSSSIAVDKYGCAYVTGEATTGFPTTANAIQPEYQGKGDVYVTKLSADGSSLIYSTFLGDSLSNSGRDIVVDDSSCAYVCGTGLTATPGALNNPGSSFLCKLNPSGDDFIYTARVYINNLAVDNNGNIYGAYFNALKGNMVFGVNRNGSDTLFKYNIKINPADLAIDADTNIYIIGSTDKDSLATENAYQTSLAGPMDAIVTKIHIEPPEMLIVKVMTDPLYDIPKPVVNTQVDIYSIDLQNSAGTLTFIESQTTDDKGLLKLPNDRYQTDMPVFIRTNPEKKSSAKNYRTDKTKYTYKVYVDNLIIDSEGNVNAQQLESDPVDTTTVYLGHTSVGFSLVASVEWLASPDYIFGLASAFIDLNNILYDVTNGQAFIDTLAVFDNATHFGDADIKIFAKNNQWPCATLNGINMNNAYAGVKLPPVWKGTPKSSIDAIYNTNPVDPTALNMKTTIVHELGHYAFGFWDEYKNKAGDKIYKNINFGFMDNQYNLNDPRSSEMSDYEESDTTFKYYKETHQFEGHGTNCWEYFQSTYTKEYDNVIAHIIRPRDLGILADNVIKGPNSDYNDPDFSVGNMMGFDFKVTTTTNPRLDVLITKSTAGGAPVPGAKTILLKKGVGRGINHGLTNEAGHIKLFNAESGDTIFAMHDSLSHWYYEKAIVAPAKKNTENADIVIELKTISGEFSLLTDLAFDVSGAPVYQCLADPLFSSLPYIKVFDDVSASENQVLSESAGIYSTTINKTDFSQGQVFFTAPDNDGKEFFVFQDAFIRDVNDQNVVSGGDLQLEYNIDTTVTTAHKVAFLASAFPPPVKGLPDSTLRVTDVISLSTWPSDADIKIQVYLHYYADSLEAEAPEALTLYKWDDGWFPLETDVDLPHNMVATTLNGSGYIVAYLDLTKSRIISHTKQNVRIETESGIKLYPNYPNPFDRTTTIKYYLSEPGKVLLKIYNSIGQELVTLVDAIQPDGEYEINWQPEGLQSGLYFYRIVVKNSSSVNKPELTKTGKMMLIR